MIRLALLLLGPRALARWWMFLLPIGAAWIAAGLWIVANLHDREVVYVEDVLAILVALEGTVRIASATALGYRKSRSELVRGLCFLLAAFLIYNVEWDHNAGATVVFGLAFLVDGLLRIGAAWVIRGQRLAANVVQGTVSILLAIVVFLRWPIPHDVTIPFCIALLLLSSGFVLLRAAWQLRRLPDGGSITALPLYSRSSWQSRGIAVPVLEPGIEPVRGCLHVRVWTATGSINDPQRQLLVDRYIAAVDRKGVVSTGHSALEVPPDLYISHYPADELDHHPDELRTILHSGQQNDVKGRFQPSLAVEAAAWCMPDQTVTFHRFNATALRAFWQAYSADDTYNLTARNCSTTVALSLDAATEGLASSGRPLRDFFQLLLNPDFWLLRIVRARAEGMTWTPGLVLDYAQVLQRVLEHGERRWREKLGSAFRSRSGEGR